MTPMHEALLATLRRTPRSGPNREAAIVLGELTDVALTALYLQWTHEAGVRAASLPSEIADHVSTFRKWAVQ